LLDFPIIAIYANGIISALNELRHCAPLSIQRSLGEKLKENLNISLQALHSYKSDHLSKLTPDQQKLFSRLCQVC